MDISIITVHLNDFDGLNSTHRSLRELLSTQQVNWLVIDGGSKLDTEDKTRCLQNIKSAADFFISEPDNGIYDAMNKGVNHAKGDYVLFLNAGDELHPKFDLEELTKLVPGSQPDMIWGRCLERYQEGRLIEVKTRTPSWCWYGMPAYHPSIFFRRESLGKSPFNTTYKIAADYDLVCRMLADEAQVEKTPLFVSIFHRGGISDLNGMESRDEENEIRLKYFNIHPVTGAAIKNFKRLNAHLARNAMFRGIWRKWI